MEEFPRNLLPELKDYNFIFLAPEQETITDSVMRHRSARIDLSNKVRVPIFRTGNDVYTVLTLALYPFCLVSLGDKPASSRSGGVVRKSSSQIYSYLPTPAAVTGRSTLHSKTRTRDDLSLDSPNDRDLRR